MFDETQMTLATDLTSQWVGGWFASEKLNGCRAYWDGEHFWTRGGNLIHAPEWFTDGLPNVALDGEIWAGRDGRCGYDSFQTARVAVQCGDHWFERQSRTGHLIEFAVFDFPAMDSTWDKRMIEAAKCVKCAKHAIAVPFHKVPDDAKGWVDFLMHVRRIGGEGAMFRNPSAKTYDLGRSDNLLRFKFFE